MCEDNTQMLELCFALNMTFERASLFTYTVQHHFMPRQLTYILMHASIFSI